LEVTVRFISTGREIAGAKSWHVDPTLFPTDENPPGIKIAKVSAVDDDCLTGLKARLMRAISNASEDRTRTEWLGCKKQTLTDWLYNTKSLVGPAGLEPATRPL
jgi:hypothetical protein